MTTPIREFSLAVAPYPVEGAPVCAWGDIGETIAKVRRIGFSGIEILLRHPDDLPANLGSVLEGQGITLRSILTGPSYKQDGLSLCEPSGADDAVRRVLEHIDFASQFGANVVLGWMLGPPPGSRAARSTLQVALKGSLTRCVAHAEANGVSLLVEPVNRYEPSLIRTARQAVGLCGEIGGMGLVLDVFHMNIEEPELGTAILDAADFLKHLHIADSNRHSPGQGHLDFSLVQTALAKIDFEGTIGMEVLPVPTADSAGEEGLAFLRRTFLHRGS